MKYPQFKDLILFENQDLIAGNKPAFLSSLDDRESGAQNVLRMAKQYWSEAQICHRLDRETSGVLLIAKNPETYRFISMQFEHRQVEKIYHAIVHGTQVYEDLQVDLPILNLGAKNVAINRQSGKAALTIFNSLKYYKHYTLIECKPLSGRMHQIRIHLASQRASIAGDEMYGGRPVFLSGFKKGYRIGKDQEELPLMRRFALHAFQIRIKINPEESRLFEAPYPKDFATLLKLLDKFDV